jgi:hypothetical protein
MKNYQILDTHDDDLKLSFYQDQFAQVYVESNQNTSFILEWEVHVDQKIMAIEDQNLFSDQNWQPSSFNLPKTYQVQAQTFIQMMKWDQLPGFYEKLNAMIKFYRYFKVEQFKDDDQSYESEYLKINYRQNGVCRHRAYAFVITALAMGIPARLVANEIHAFVEVQFPSQNWKLIDLGGYPSDVEKQNQSRPPTRPKDFLSHVSLDEVHSTVQSMLKDQATDQATEQVNQQTTEQVYKQGVDVPLREDLNLKMINYFKKHRISAKWLKWPSEITEDVEVRLSAYLSLHQKKLKNQKFQMYIVSQEIYQKMISNEPFSILEEPSYRAMILSIQTDEKGFFEVHFKADSLAPNQEYTYLFFPESLFH